jgi:two-component system nitrate/nitrite response regulator NarL
MPSQDNIRVLLVEKHALTRGAFRALISGWPAMEVVAEAEAGGEALGLVAEDHPDIVLLDLSLGENSSEAFSLLTDLRKGGYQARVIVLADGEDISCRVQAVVLGAAGVVLRDQSVGILKKAIEKVHAGEVWLERTLTASVLREMAGQSSTREPDPGVVKLNSLSDREREIVERVCESLSNREIGHRLAISEATVRHHLTSIYNKLGIQNRLELVIFAYDNDLGSARPRALNNNHRVNS